MTQRRCRHHADCNITIQWPGRKDDETQTEDLIWYFFATMRLKDFENELIIITLTIFLSEKFQPQNNPKYGIIWIITRIIEIFLDLNKHERFSVSNKHPNFFHLNELSLIDWWNPKFQASFLLDFVSMIDLFCHVFKILLQTSSHIFSSFQRKIV